MESTLQKYLNSMKTFTILLIFTFLNITLTFTLVSILTDGILTYQTGFYVLAPFILGLTVTLLYFLYKQTEKFKMQKINSLNYSFTIGYFIVNCIILYFNYTCWIDLFDGSTKDLLP